MKRDARFWLIYVAAWLPYAASYVAIFLVQDSRTALWSAIQNMLYSIVTAAVLGLLVLWLCRRLPWTLNRRPWFFAAHLVGAALYAAAWLAAVDLSLTVAVSLRRGRLSPFVLSGYALQWQLFSGLMIYGTLASVAYVVQVAERLRHEEARAARADAARVQAEHLRTRAELEALRAQLNPHFLFNTLHSLMALVRHNPPAAEDALERFSGLLRYVLDVNRDGEASEQDVTLGEEWAFVRDYLALEGLRLGDRLKVDADVDTETLDRRVPAFTLQPLVENAIKHSIAPHSRPGRLRISACLEADDTLRLEVADDGAGASAAALADAPGLGLQIVRRRLAARYAGAAEFRIETTPGEGFKVLMRLPPEASGVRSEDVELSEVESSWRYARS